MKVYSIKGFFIVLMLFGFFLASSHAQTKPKINQKQSENLIPLNWTDKYDYLYYDDGSCRPSSYQVCISKDDYEKACKVTKRITKNFYKELEPLGVDSERRDLIDGGKMESLNISWNGKQCVATVTVSGIIRGTSKRQVIQVVINGFVSIESQIAAFSSSDYYGR